MCRWAEEAVLRPLLHVVAVTTRGMREGEMDVIAGLIVRALESPADDRKLAAIASEVRDLCARFPIYRHRLQ